MKKKILIAASSVLVLVIAFFTVQRLKKNQETSPGRDKQFYGSSSGESPKDASGQEKTVDREEDGSKHAAASPATTTGKNIQAESKTRGFFEDERRLSEGGENLGKVFYPGFSPGAAGVSAERKLEYNLSVAYQVDSIKSARAFFTQWIPRYGFLLHETATGSHNGYLNLQVRIRSRDLYAALHDLDQIGNLASENITVTDHTENSVHQQMLRAREEIRKSRRLVANQSTTTAAKSWEATENLLSASEDREIATRMEEWRIHDRTQWATLHISLSLPYVPAPAAVEVPAFRNAFVGLLNLLMQLVYAAIYIVPFALLGYVAYRGVLRIFPAVRRVLPRPI